MNISIYAEKKFDEIQYPCMIKKILQKLGKERNHVNSTKSLYKRPTADIIFNGK